MWTLTHTPLIGDPETRTLEAWGVTGVAVELRSFAAGTVTMTAPSEFDGAALFTNGASGTLLLDDVVVFRGRFSRESRSGSGNAEAVQYTLHDAWHDLTRRFYISPTTAYADLFNGTTTVAQQLEAIIDAAEAAGVAIQFGSAANMAYSPRAIELRDARLADVLTAARRLVPDAQSWMDYTTTPPTIHFVRRADAAAVSMAITALTRVDIEPLHDLVVSAVVLRYARMLSTAGAPPALSVISDKHPIDATGAEENAVVATLDLRGNQLQTQELSTNNISLSSRAWWARFYPWVSPGNEDLEEGGDFGFEDTERQMQNVDGEWVTDTTGSVYEVVDGGVPGWLSDARQVLCRATLTDFMLDGVQHDTYQLETTVQATSLSGGIYTRETVAAEAVPTGIAEELYDALSVLHFSGQLTRTDAELITPLTHCAQVLNLTGGEASARGWTSMRAVIQAARYDIDSATTELRIGPPDHLGPADLLEVARLKGTSGVEITALGASTGNAGGLRRAAGNNTVPPKPQSAHHPFYLFETGRIGLGTVNGSHIPLSGGVEIGSTGAEVDLTDLTAYIYIKAELTLTRTASGALISWEWLGGLSDLIVVSSATPLEDAVTSTTMTTYLLIAQVVAGVPQRPQPVTSSQNLTVCSNGGTTVAATWTSA